MKLGLGPIPLQGMARHELERLATAAVEASFDSVWVAESRSQGVGGGLAAAALVAQLVPIRVGALVDAGVYHPLHMAEDIAIADLTSQGRLEVLLRGGSDEHLQVLVAALSGAQYFSHTSLPLLSQPCVMESPRKTSWASPFFEISLNEACRASVLMRPPFPRALPELFSPRTRAGVLAAWARGAVRPGAHTRMGGTASRRLVMRPGPFRRLEWRGFGRNLHSRACWNLRPGSGRS